MPFISSIEKSLIPPQKHDEDISCHTLLTHQVLKSVLKHKIPCNTISTIRQCERYFPFFYHLRSNYRLFL